MRATALRLPHTLNFNVDIETRSAQQEPRPVGRALRRRFLRKNRRGWRRCYSVWQIESCGM